MNLNHTDAAEHFASDTDHNIWNQPQEQDEDDTPAFLRRRKKRKETKES
jgi:hypothetical protein